MNKIDVNLVKETGDYVSKLLAEKLPDSIEFHTIDHAKCVVDNAEYFGKNSGLTDDEINTVRLSAWFHDWDRHFGICICICFYQPIIFF